MAKKIIQDVVIKQKEIKKEVKEVKEVKREFGGKKRGFFKKFLWFCVVIVIIVLGGMVLIKFSSATVKVTPHQEFIDVDKELNLNFEIIQLEREESQSVTATEVVADGQKAKGQVVIYNTYSSNPQRLLIETRLETPDGKIYKTEKALVVPGNGSVELTVYADKPGPEYNIGLTDFNIVGFKGTSRYEKIYGRSKTEMTGGAKENSLVVSEKDIANAKNNLKQKIENYLKEKITQQKPAEYLLYENALKIDFTDSFSDPIFKEKGKATGFLLKKDDLTKILTENKEEISIVNLEKLDFNLISANATTSKITFSLKGKVHLVWDIDTDSLADSLIETKDKNYQYVFKKYPGIDRAEIIFKPVWWNWMPSDKSRIHFEMVLLNQQ